MALNLKKPRMINFDKLLELRLALADARYSGADPLLGPPKKKRKKPEFIEDQTLSSYPAKKKKKKKPKKVKVEIEDVSDGKL